jgi:hypothetical protein
VEQAAPSGELPPALAAAVAAAQAAVEAARREDEREAGARAALERAKAEQQDALQRYAAVMAESTFISLFIRLFSFCYLVGFY